VNDLHEAEQARHAVQAVKRGRPDVHLTILAPESLKGFWSAVAGVDAVISLPSRLALLRTVIRLRRSGPFDAGILLPPGSRGAWEMVLAGVPHRLGAPGRSFLNHWHNAPGVSDPPLEGGERYHRIVQLAGSAI
jgi:ADP-heptose:LPS heptosyltransferase